VAGDTCHRDHGRLASFADLAPLVVANLSEAGFTLGLMFEQRFDRRFRRGVRGTFSGFEPGIAGPVLLGRRPSTHPTPGWRAAPGTTAGRGVGKRPPGRTGPIH